MENSILKKENIKLNVGKLTKLEAIQMAGRLLVEAGCVTEAYIQGMLDREKVYSTYIGNGVAIPHGIGQVSQEIKKSGIVVLQSKEGVIYDEEAAYLIIGIAGAGDAHLQILSNIALIVQDEVNVKRAIEAKTADEIYEILLSEFKG